MAKKLWHMFGGTVFAGFFFAVASKIGTSVEPKDLATKLAGKVVLALNIPEANVLWGIVVVILAILGIFQLAANIYSYIKYGWHGIIVSSAGFLGALSIVGVGSTFALCVGLGLICIGLLVCLFKEGKAPRDIFERSL